MDQMKRIVNVQHVKQENIHHQVLKNVFHVMQLVEMIVLLQQENVINVLQDMDFQVVFVQHVHQENIQQEEQVHVYHVQMNVMMPGVKQPLENVLVVILVMNLITEIAARVLI